MMIITYFLAGPSNTHDITKTIGEHNNLIIAFIGKEYDLHTLRFPIILNDLKTIAGDFVRIISRSKTSTELCFKLLRLRYHVIPNYHVAADIASLHDLFNGYTDFVFQKGKSLGSDRTLLQVVTNSDNEIGIRWCAGTLDNVTKFGPPEYYDNAEDLFDDCKIKLATNRRPRQLNATIVMPWSKMYSGS